MKLELLLKGIDQMSSVVKKQSVFLRQLDKDATKTYNSLKKLFGLSPKANFTNFGKQSASEFRKADTAANRLKKTLESVSKIQIKSPKISAPIYSPKAAPRDAAPQTNPERGSRELDRIYARHQRPRNYVDRLANLDERLIQPAAQIKNVWKEQYDSLKPYVEETKKLYRAQESFKLLNLSGADNKTAFDSVRQIVKDVKGATLSDATEDLIDLYGALGNLNSATRALPLATKFRTNFTALFGDKLSSEEIGTQIQSGFKFLEIIGATNKGRGETEKMFDTITKISNSTGGRITGANFLAMAKTGKTSVKNLTTEGLMNISSMIEEGGAGNTGTALMSLSQALVGGVMKQSAKERFHHFGLIDEDKIEYGKGQQIKNLKPGANKLGALMQEDPLKAADMLREAMAKHGVNTNDAKKVDEELSILFQNRNAQALMSSLINQRDQVVKEADRARNAKGVLGMDSQPANSELKKIQEFEAAIKNFKTEPGIPLIQVGTQITSALTPFIKLAGEHPTITKFAVASMLVGKSISGIAQSASAQSGGGIASFFRNAETSATGAGAAFRKTSGELGGVSNKMSGIKALGKIGLSVVVAEGAMLAIAGVAQMIDEAVERPRELKIKTKAIDHLYDKLMGLGLLYEKPGDYGENGKNKPAIDELAKQQFDAMNNKNDLVNALHPEKTGWWEWATNPNPYGIAPGQKDGGATFNPDVAVNRWSKGGGLKLQDPNVLARLLLYMKQGAKDEKGEARMNANDYEMVLPALEREAGQDNMKVALEILADESSGRKKVETPADPNQGKGFFNSKTGLFDVPYKTTKSAQSTEPFPFLKPFKEGDLKTVVKDLSGNTDKASQAFTQIINPVSGTAKGFFDLSGKGDVLGGSFGGLNTNANSSVSAINSMTGAALNFASTVSTLQIQPPSFGTINIPGFGAASPPPPKYANPSLHTSAADAPKAAALKKVVFTKSAKWAESFSRRIKAARLSVTTFCEKATRKPI